MQNYFFETKVFGDRPLRNTFQGYIDTLVTLTHQPYKSIMSLHFVPGGTVADKRKRHFSSIIQEKE